MRKILFVVLALFTISMAYGQSFFAQKLEVGMNSGLGFNTNPTIESNVNAYGGTTKRSGMTPTFAIKGLYNYRQWQFGVQAGYMQLSYKAPALAAFIPENNIPYSTVFISRTTVPVKAVVNRNFSTGHFRHYAGLSAGYVYAGNSEDLNAQLPEYFGKVSGHGFTAGLQVGSTYFVSRRFGINAEVSADYISITLGAASYKLISFPASIGIRYKL